MTDQNSSNSQIQQQPTYYVYQPQNPQSGNLYPAIPQNGNFVYSNNGNVVPMGVPMNAPFPPQAVPQVVYYVPTNAAVPNGPPPMYTPPTQQPEVVMMPAMPMQTVVQPQVAFANNDVSKDELRKQHQLGTFGKFVGNFVAALFFPIISSLVAFAMESTQLSKLGNVFGSFTFFFWLGFFFIGIGTFEHSYCGYEYYTTCTDTVFYPVSIPFFLVSVVFLILGSFMLKKYLQMYKYHIPQSDSFSFETTKLGTTSGFAFAFMGSVLFPLIGTAMAMIISRSVYTRYGAMVGFAFITILVAIVFASAIGIVTLITGNTVMIVGLGLLFISVVYFERAKIVVQNRK